MLFMPEHSPIYRYFAIDPGSNTMGLSVCDLDLITKRLTIVDTVTVVAERLSRNNVDQIEYHGLRASRLLAHQEYLETLLHRWQPHGIICESAYMGSFAQAYAALVETITYLKLTVFKYNPYIYFELIDPSSAKKNIKARISGKGDVKDAVLALAKSEIDYRGRIPIELLDEHSYDSISISYYKYKQMLNLI